MLLDSGIDGPTLLDDVGRFVRRFVVMNEHQATVCALWAAHTHAIDAAWMTPYLMVTSALKMSGKSHLRDLLKLVVREPLSTANISDAALFRAIGEFKPTLLFDEIDAIFGRKARDREDLRGMLNAGFERGAVVYRMGGVRMTTLESFPVFCPKMFMGIGTLPDTISSRSISVRLERKTKAERVQRLRIRDVTPEGHELGDRLTDWLEPQLDYLAGVRPVLPDELDDRAQDIWEPLLAIADSAGGDWPERARTAALVLSANGERRDEEQTVQLLRDIEQVFSANGTTRFKKTDLISELVKFEESPWGDWFGKPITPRALSMLLKPFRIQTMTVKVDGEAVRGYKVEQFADAFHRVLGVTGVTSVTSRMTPDAAGNGGDASNAYPTGDVQDLSDDIPL
jgi:hypothetical protein